MEEDVNLFRAEAEEPMRLDDLQGLIHHRGGVDRDLGAHVPNGMGERIVDRDLFQLLKRGITKRAAAGSEHNAGDFFSAAGLQRLENRAMLAVDRKDHGAALGSQLGDELPAHHKRFFIRQGDGFLGSESGPGAAQAGATNDAGQNDVDFFRRGDLLESFLADHHLGAFREIGPRMRRAAASSVATIQRGRNWRACATSSSRRRWAERAMACRRPSLAAITSSALVPMLPVEPRTATLRVGDEFEGAIITVS